jgi:hypothetical protein
MQQWGSVQLLAIEIPGEITRTDGFTVSQPGAGLSLAYLFFREKKDLENFVQLDLEWSKGTAKVTGRDELHPRYHGCCPDTGCHCR